MEILDRDIQSQQPTKTLSSEHNKTLGSEHNKAVDHRIGTYLLLLAVASASSALYSFTVINYLSDLLGASTNTWLILIGLFFTSVIVGAKLASQFSKRIFNPLKIFALVQASTGFLSAGLFSVFVFLTNTPLLTMPISTTPLGWLSVLLLIAPQAILLGLVFPLLSFGILRCGPGKTGRSISLLYFFYGSGLTTGLVVVSLLSVMDTSIAATIQLSSLVHLIAAFFVCSLSVADGRNPMPLEHPLSRNLCKKPLHPRLILLFLLSIGVVTSLYEIIWIPLLSRISPHSAELLFACAIFGLAMGAFATKNKSKKKIIPLPLLLKLKLFVFSLLGISIFINTIFLGSDKGIQYLTSFSSQYPGTSIFLACVIVLSGTLSLGATMPLTIYMEKNTRWDESVFGNHYAHALMGIVAGISFSFLFLS